MVSLNPIWVAAALDALRSNIAAANQMGNVEGHLARHLLKEDARLGISWVVDCNDEWMDRSYDPANLASVAALAYTVARTGNTRYLSQLETGLQRATARDPRAAGHGAALHESSVFLGLCLGGQYFSATCGRYSAWCASVATNPLQKSQSSRFDAMTAYAARLCGAATVGAVLDLNGSIADRAAFDWWYRLPENQGQVPIEVLTELRRGIVEELLSKPMEQLPAHQAALLWLSLREAVAQTASALMHTAEAVADVLREFEPSMKRWRWDSSEAQDSVRWIVRSEREVQDIVWLMLRPICRDLVDEDTLPKFGHSAYRPDFGVPSLGLLVEIKYARRAADFKSIEKEILEDLVPYLRTPDRYRRVLVFIYDASSSVQVHDTTRKALCSVAGISDVIIVCRPSQLPA